MPNLMVQSRAERKYQVATGRVNGPVLTACLWYHDQYMKHGNNKIICQYMIRPDYHDYKSKSRDTHETMR